MAQRGRPLSLNTCVVRLRHLSDTAVIEPGVLNALIDIASALEFKPKLPPRMLSDMVAALDTIHRENQFDDQQDKSMTQVIDSLARWQTVAEKDGPIMRGVKPAPKAATKGKPDWMTDNERAADNARNVSVQSIVGAMIVILGEVKAGDAGDDDFDALVHLTRTLQRIY